MDCDDDAVTEAPFPPRPEPSRRVADRARGLWTVGALSWALPLAIGAPIILDAVGGIPAGLRALAVAAAIVVAAVGALIVPQLRWRRWRWEVRDEEIDLRHGGLTEVRTIVPMTRVQHVDVRRSLIQQNTGTADLVVHTAAGQTTIPMLPEAAAVEVRDRIADLARAPDEL